MSNVCPRACVPHHNACYHPLLSLLNTYVCDIISTCVTCVCTGTHISIPHISHSACFHTALPHSQTHAHTHRSPPCLDMRPHTCTMHTHLSVHTDVNTITHHLCSGNPCTSASLPCTRTQHVLSQSRLACTQDFFTCIPLQLTCHINNTPTPTQMH